MLPSSSTLRAAGCWWSGAFTTSTRTSDGLGAAGDVGAALCTSLELTRSDVCGTVDESLMDGPRLCVCASQYRLVSKHTPTARPAPRLLQKERTQFVKVRPRTTIGRAPSPTARVHTPSVRLHVLTVRLRPCATQASSDTRWARAASACRAARAAWAREWSHSGRGEVALARLPCRSVSSRCRSEAAGGRRVGCQGGLPEDCRARHAP